MDAHAVGRLRSAGVTEYEVNAGQHVAERMAARGERVGYISGEGRGKRRVPLPGVADQLDRGRGLRLRRPGGEQQGSHNDDKQGRQGKQRPAAGEGRKKGEHHAVTSRRRWAQGSGRLGLGQEESGGGG